MNIHAYEYIQGVCLQLSQVSLAATQDQTFSVASLALLNKHFIR